MEGWMWIVADILITISVFIIAYKANHPMSWLAFIPIGNLWLMSDMADQGILSFLLLFLPIINIFVYIWLWMKISEYTNKPQWLGLFMILPVINVGVAMYMALYEPDIRRR